MKTSLVVALAVLAFAVPAQAQVVIEEAPGAADSSMEPTHFLTTETARILPANLNVIGIGVGGVLPYATANFQYGRGMGAGGELRLNAATVLQQPSTGSVTFGGGLGYKQRLAIAGPFDVALEGYGAYYQLPTASYNFQAGLPATAVLGPGDLTLEPRALFYDVTGGRASLYGLQAGYRVPVGQARLLFEGSGAWHSGGYPVYAGKLGLRYAVLPNLNLDGFAGVDWWGAGRHLGMVETFSTTGAALHFSL